MRFSANVTYLEGLHAVWCCVDREHTVSVWGWNDAGGKREKGQNRQMETEWEWMSKD